MHDEVLSCQRVPVTRLDVISYHNGDSHCQDADCPCHEAMTQVLVERTPVVRIPVSQRYAVSVLGGRNVCNDPNCPCHKAAEHYGNYFYESIIKLVWQLSFKYRTSCYMHEVKDLCSICLSRLYKNLHKYDPQWAVSTFVWTVCTNVLNDEAERIKRMSGLMVPLDVNMDHARKDSDPFLAAEIRQAVNELKASYPQWEDVILAIFTGVENTREALPDKLCVSRVAEATNRKYNDVYMFVKKVVRPFFITRFQTEGEEQSE